MKRALLNPFFQNSNNSLQLKFPLLLTHQTYPTSPLEFKSVFKFTVVH